MEEIFEDHLGNSVFEESLLYHRSLSPLCVKHKVKVLDISVIFSQRLNR